MLIIEYEILAGIMQDMMHKFKYNLASRAWILFSNGYIKD